MFHVPPDHLPPAHVEMIEVGATQKRGLISINHTKHQSNDYQTTPNQGSQSQQKKKKPLQEKTKPSEKAIVTAGCSVVFERLVPNEFRMTQPCYFELMSDLASIPPEEAGLLFGPMNDDSLITHYIPESRGHSTSVSFSLDADFINRSIRQLKVARLSLKGIVHSHPASFRRLSGGDLHYINRLFVNPQNRDVTEIFMPIVCGQRLIPFLVDQFMNVTEPRFFLV